jgi:sugar O-acyltransferase (sialic acid O-acetyltransferase NeuD family)
MRKILLFGASGHAKVVIDILEKSGLWDIVGIIDGRRADTEATVYGHKVLGSDEDLPRIAQEMSVDHGIIAVGDNFRRAKIRQKILGLCPEFKFGSAIHPGSVIARGVSVGEGTVIMAGAVVNSDTRIGRFCIVNTNASMDHDSQLEDFASLAPGAVLGGNVTIGAFSAVSLGAMVKHGIAIGEHSVVGAGAIVMRDVQAYCVCYGQPSRFVRARQPGDSYL